MTPPSMNGRSPPAHFLDGMSTTPPLHSVFRRNYVVSTRVSHAPDLRMLSSTEQHSGHLVPLCRCISRGTPRAHVWRYRRARGHHLLTRQEVLGGKTSSSRSLLTSIGSMPVSAWSSNFPCLTSGGVPVWMSQRVRNSSLSILIVHHV
jgi:hypothetical protein